MAIKTLHEERDAVDHITECMYSTDFLRSISDAIFDPERRKTSVAEFHEDWFRSTGSDRKALIPFNPGVILAFLYVGILFTKENWFDLIPNVELSKSDLDWGVRDAVVTAPKKPNPTLQYTFKRIRNSLGHGTPVFNLPADTTKENMLQKATFSFHDVNMHDQTDTFDVTLTLDQLIAIVKKFQSVIHKHVREKKEA